MQLTMYHTNISEVRMMNIRTKDTSIPTTAKLCIDTAELQQMLCAGRKTAIKMGIEAGARIKVGTRVMWNVKKVSEYLDSISK